MADMANPAQFSIRLLMGAVATAAAPLGVMVAKPSWQVGVATILVVIWLPSIFVAGMLNARSWLKAFCAGAAIPSVLAANVFATFSFMASLNLGAQSWQEFAMAACNPDVKSPLKVFWLTIPVAGLSCTIAQWLFRDGANGAKAGSSNNVA